MIAYQAQDTVAQQAGLRQAAGAAIKAAVDEKRFNAKAEEAVQEAESKASQALKDATMEKEVNP